MFCDNDFLTILRPEHGRSTDITTHVHMRASNVPQKNHYHVKIHDFFTVYDNLCHVLSFPSSDSSQGKIFVIFRNYATIPHLGGGRHLIGSCHHNRKLISP